MAEEPCGSIPVAGFFSAAFAPEFLKSATMAEPSPEVVVHFIVGPDIDGVFETGTGALEGLAFRLGFLPAFPTHGNDRGGNRCHKKKIDHVGDDYLGWV